MKSYIKKIGLSLTLSLVLFSLALTPILAQESITDRMKGAIKTVDLPTAGTEVDDGAQEIIGNVIGAFLSIFGAFFLILVIYGGFKWMNAKGNQEEIDKAKSVLRSATIGFLIVMLSYAISYFVAAGLQAATT